MKNRFFFVTSIVIFLFLSVRPAHAFLIQGTVKSINTSTVKIKEAEFIPLIHICRAYGVSYSWDSLTHRVRLYNKGKLLTIMMNESVVDIDGVLNQISHPPQMNDGTFVVPKSILDLPWWGPVEKPKPKIVQPPVTEKIKKYVIDTIILDPGHGGKDRGAFGNNGTKEKDLTLLFCQKLKKELERRGITVLLTRNRDFFVSLADRAKMANNSEADLFLSIHANAHPSSRAHGFEMFYLSNSVNDRSRVRDMIENKSCKADDLSVIPDKYKSDPTLWDIVLTENRREAIKLAKFIDKSVKNKDIAKNRGVKGARYYVLKWVDKPAVLIELGFLTNHNEEKRLNDAVYLDKFVQSIVLGIVEYRNEYEEEYNT
jgi:N-acetylmuramoyl-L-alanine amidase